MLTLHGYAEVQKELQLELDADTDFEDFKAAAQHGNVVSMHERIFSDHLTPVLAYRCLVRQDDRSAPSFLFEAVNNGTQQVEPATWRVGTCAAEMFCLTLSAAIHDREISVILTSDDQLGAKTRSLQAFVKLITCIECLLQVLDCMHSYDAGAL